MAVSQLVGAKIHRREDPRLITGHGHYVDDFTRQSTAYAAFVRSPFAHARIKSIDITDASKAPGVVGVYTARDFKGQLAGTHAGAGQQLDNEPVAGITAGPGSGHQPGRVLVVEELR